eukprot:4056233-Pyramimonas_sp.AAC.1
MGVRVPVSPEEQGAADSMRRQFESRSNFWQGSNYSSLEALGKSSPQIRQAVETCSPFAGHFPAPGSRRCRVADGARERQASWPRSD